MQIASTAKNNSQKYFTELESRTHKYSADEPREENGTDLAPTPTELLAAALAACTTITLRMYADRKQWDAGEITVQVVKAENTVENNTSIFERKITFSGNLLPDQKQRLLQIANACPVHKILHNPTQITTEII